MQGGIVGDAQERRQHELIYFLGEGLAFGVAALAMAFQAVSENFVEENSGGAAGKHGRTRVRFGNRSGAQRFQIGGDLVDLGLQFGFGRKLVGRGGLKSFDAQKIHAIVGAGVALNDQAAMAEGWTRAAPSLVAR